MRTAQCAALLIVCITLVLAQRPLELVPQVVRHRKATSLQQQQQQPPPPVEPPVSTRVCHFARTYLGSRKFTPAFREYAVDWMRKQTVRSLVLQEVPHDVYYEVIASLPDETVDLAALEIATPANVRLTVTHLDWRNVMISRLNELQCDWYAVTILDADDVVADGLVRTVRSEALQLRSQGFEAAVLGAPRLAHLIIGFGRCQVVDRLTRYYSGWSVGQTIIASNEVVHTAYMDKENNFDMKEQSKKLPKDEEELRKYLAIDDFNAQLTGVKMISNRYLGVYMATPLSSHYPWKLLESFPVCDEQQRVKVKQAAVHYGYDVGAIDFDHILNEADSGLAPMDACLSNMHFVHSQYKDYKLFKSYESECSELEDIHIPVADDWLAAQPRLKPNSFVSVSEGS